jgi:hypothetical protein
MDRGGRRTPWVSRRRRLACRSSGSRLACSSLHPLEQLGHFRAEDVETDFRRRHALFQKVTPASLTSSAGSTGKRTAHASSSLFTMLRLERSARSGAIAPVTRSGDARRSGLRAWTPPSCLAARRGSSGWCQLDSGASALRALARNAESGAGHPVVIAFETVRNVGLRRLGRTSHRDPLSLGDEFLYILCSLTGALQIDGSGCTRRVTESPRTPGHIDV